METQNTHEIIPNLSPEAALMLSKLLEPVAKLARNAVAVGEKPVAGRFTLQVNGKIKIGEDYQQRIVQKANPWGLVHVLLEELQELTIAATGGGVDLNVLVRRALVCDENLQAQAEERANKIAASLKEETRQTCRGKTTVTGRLDVVEVSQ